MSSIRARVSVTLGIGILLIAAACSDPRKDATIFNPTTGKHPDTWIVDHRAAFVSDSGQCKSCHGSDLRGGISGVSCYSASFNGMSCHANGPSGHPAGWSDPGSHGASTKDAPDANLGNGFQYCERCHGADFAGGTVNVSCFSCHGVSAPHSPAPWRGGARTHTTTDPGNAAVCNQCHALGANSTRQPVPPYGTTPDCFNNSLCHGVEGHPVGWSSPDVHGASAKSAPGTSSGFAYCETCHSSNFTGGSANVSCLNTAGCHGATVASPHSPAPWRGGTRTHTDTNVQNASVCNQCHALGANSTRQPVPPYGSVPDCFNNSLCHGSEVAGHALPYTDPAVHGPTAKSDLTYCQGCHANPSSSGAGTNPRFNVTIGSLATGCEGGSCHVTNTAHPRPWSANNAYPTSHQSAGNMANACALCHGASLNGGTGPACTTCHTAGSPLTLTNCTSCHASPPTGTSTPNTAGSHTKHNAIPGVTGFCGPCHSNAGSGTALHDNATVNVAISPTYNGTVPASFNASAHTCSNVSCHADAYSSGSATTPPWGTASGCGTCHGNSASGAPATGSHTSHTGIATCSSCHAGAVSGVSGGTSHLDGNIDVTDGYPANVTKHPAGTGYSTCTSASCHASAYSAGVVTSPTWGTAADCGSCHPVAANGAPATGSHAAHLTAGTVCADCHNGAVKDVNGGTQHTDGNIDVYKTTPGDLGYPQNVAKHAAGSGYSSCSTASCHGTATWGVAGAIDCVSCHSTTQTITAGPLAGQTRRAVSLEFANTWSHKRSAGGTVNKYDCIVCHMEGDMSTGSRNATYHGNGYIELRDPDTGATIKGVTFGGTDPGSYTSTGTDMVFTRFSRNLSSNVLEPEVQAIMINQCLKCHDANGATSTSAQVPGGSAEKPFATTIAGAAYTGAGVTANGVLGGVTDINAALATSNSSYHPVRGRQNNWYAKLTRMVAPWNTATRGATADTTSWGHLISCWDCHALPSDTGTITRTVTAHGAAATLRGVATVTGTPAAGSNQVTFCIVCHAGYDSNTSSHHGAGSALASSTNGGMTTYLRYGCNYCHSSSITAVRPTRAENVHGFNRLPGTGTDARWPTGTTETSRPYAFIRNTAAPLSLTNHRPLTAVSELTTGSAQCSAPGTTSPCDDSMGTYTPGGVY